MNVKKKNKSKNVKHVIKLNTILKNAIEIKFVKVWKEKTY